MRRWLKVPVGLFITPILALPGPHGTDSKVKCILIVTVAQTEFSASPVAAHNTPYTVYAIYFYLFIYFKVLRVFFHSVLAPSVSLVYPSSPLPLLSMLAR